MKIAIGYLYPDLMNIYGDTGNIIALKKRAEWRGIEIEVKNISIGDKLQKGGVDLYFFGGGQDQQQGLVVVDLVKNGPSTSLGTGKGKVIKSEVKRGVPLLAICGGYQLLGEYYKPHGAPKLTGVGLFPAYTLASGQRMIGNIVIEIFPSTPLREYWLSERSESKPYLVGFENHSGKTYLRKGAKPLGQVVSGFGNNGEDKTEGCIYKNAIGTYMHGSLLPKNPQLADWLLQKALETKYGSEIKLETLDDSLESQAHIAAFQRFS